MEFTAKMLADLLHGTVDGDENIKVSSFSKIEDGTPGSLTFLSNMKYVQYIYTTKASIVLVNSDFKPDKPIEATLLRVPNAYEALAQLMQMYNAAIASRPQGIEQPSHIAEGVEIHDDAYVGAFAYIAKGVTVGKNFLCYPQVYIGENVTIGDNVTLYPGVKIYHGCVLGNNVTLHAGCVVGSDGFGFAPKADGTFDKIPQIGNVVIQDDVEIGANTTIDRSTMGSTVIEKGVKLDNLIQVAHNCVVGSTTVIAAQVGLAGSTILGKNCFVGGQAGFAGHMTVPDNCTFAAKTGVTHKITEPGTYVGSYVMPKTKFFKAHVLFGRLPEIYKDLEDLKKEVAKLKQNDNTNE